MSTTTRAAAVLAPAVLAFAAFTLPAGAAAPRKAAKPATAAAPRPTSEIIPLPLNPVLPAGQRLCTARTASGLGTLPLKPATGPHPAAADFVLVNYIGYLAATGAVFDQGTRASFPVGGVIPGFAEGLQTLAKGGIARFCIPAALGYGERATGPIPANADLVFQVELLDYRTAAEIEAMRKAQAEAATKPDPAPGK